MHETLHIRNILHIIYIHMQCNYTLVILAILQNAVVRDMVDTVLESGLLCEEHCSEVTALKDTNQQVSATSKLTLCFCSNDLRCVTRAKVNKTSQRSTS